MSRYVIATRLLDDKEMEYESVKSCSRYLDVSKNNIMKVITGKSQSYGGYKFRHK